jgi:xanthine/uracil permease
LFQAFPGDLAPLLHSGVLLSILVSMALNAAFNGFDRARS